MIADVLPVDSEHVPELLGVALVANAGAATLEGVPCKVDWNRLVCNRMW